MMKKFLLLLNLLILHISLFGQLNMSNVSNLTYDENLNDIWGYAAPNGDEYALVGLRSGVSVVSLIDPANPVEVSFLPGLLSTWRDIKTWGQFAYATNETGNGVMVINLTDPNNATSTDYTELDNGDILTNVHNIYIDENGFAYLAGSSLNNGGAVILDLSADPANPTFVAYGNAIYSHDFYARDNILYASEIWEQSLTLYDVSDKDNIVPLGTEITPFEFTHNAWPNDAGDVVFTTDEKPNAPVAAYNVSDPNDIQLLDKFVPLVTAGTDVIPHNVHVWNDWLIVSYYTDGCILVDASNPSNLIEVGNFDTFLEPTAGFQGAWGAYPFLPSGLVLVSDIGNGLFVLQPDYVRAAFLEGVVADAVTNAPIDGVEVSITATQANGDVSNVNGNYATGLATAGTYDVTFTADGYEPMTVQATIENGEITILDVTLIPTDLDVAFAASVTTGCTPTIVNFTPLVANASSWSWTFENGTPATSTDENPSISFQDEGSFGITLSATTPNGVEEFTLEDYIVVNTTPQTNFDIAAINDFEVTFENTTTNATAFFWNFGDGQTSSAMNPIHTYEMMGNYIVSLTASNQCGAFMSSGIVPITAVSTNEIDETITMKAFPNPFSKAMTVEYQLESLDDTVLRIYNLLGQEIEQRTITDINGTIQLGSEYESGIYFLRIENADKVSESIRIIKN